MAKRLSDEVIAARMVELRNLRKLHAAARKREIAKDARIAELETMLTDQKTYFEGIIETQAAQIAELQTMVFGRKPKGGLPANATKATDKAARSAASYRRPIPPAAAITSEEHYPIDQCNRCGHVLTDKREAIRYEEDIVLAALSPDVPHQTVAKHTIETGWCSHCGQMSSAKDLRGQVVTLGPVVRSLIVYLVVQSDQTYSQTQDLLWQLYRFKVSSSEIAVVLSARRQAYLPLYEQLKASVRASPAHMDETSCPIQSEQGAGYAHVMVGADGTPAEHDVVYVLADSRGKGNSKKLVGNNYQSVGITDRYASYQDLFVLHQICWAHLHRNARDITRLECLGKTKQKHVTKFYDLLAAIYADIRQYRAEPYDEVKRRQQADDLLKRTKDLCRPHQLDPKKLQDLKAGILKYQDCLFVCLTVDGIPADNNKAERALRKLVIKRKKSFGVKTKKGARTLEVLLSVCQSLYNRDKDSFLVNLHGLATVS
jgi:transposase